MNPFESLQNDTVWLVKKDGRRLGPYNTSMGPKASIFEPNLDVDEGDHLERILPNEKVEVHHVTECSFSQGLGSIGPHWTLTLRKGPEKERSQMKHTTVNIHNSNGIQVGDYNTQHIENGIADLLKKIEGSEASKEDIEQAKGRVAQMLEHPLISAILGSGVGALIGLAGS